MDFDINTAIDTLTKQRDDLDFYTEMMDYTSQYGYQALFVQRYNAMDESQRQTCRARGNF